MTAAKTPYGKPYSPFPTPHSLRPAPFFFRSSFFFLPLLPIPYSLLPPFYHALGTKAGSFKITRWSPDWAMTKRPWR
jgi:hypothetical protein